MGDKKTGNATLMVNFVAFLPFATSRMSIRIERSCVHRGVKMGVISGSFASLHAIKLFGRLRRRKLQTFVI